MPSTPTAAGVVNAAAGGASGPLGSITSNGGLGSGFSVGGQGVPTQGAMQNALSAGTPSYDAVAAFIQGTGEQAAQTGINDAMGAQQIDYNNQQMQDQTVPQLQSQFGASGAFAQAGQGSQLTQAQRNLTQSNFDVSSQVLNQNNELERQHIYASMGLVV